MFVPANEWLAADVHYEAFWIPLLFCLIQFVSITFPTFPYLVDPRECSTERENELMNKQINKLIN